MKNMKLFFKVEEKMSWVGNNNSKKKNGNKLKMTGKEINKTDGNESHYWWRYGVPLKLVKKDKIF